MIDDVFESVGYQCHYVSEQHHSETIIAQP